ncbi:MAG: hypothetical protein REI11_11275, partial [Patulibacter sp.]|nr:hypothetical protein [Patulibacter sp.]
MSRAGRRRTRRPRIAPAAAAVALLATLGLAACGSPDPLASFTAPQRTQLDAAWTAVINATDTANLTELDRTSRAKTLYAACKPLDKSNALLAALADACRPLYVSKKLDLVIPTRCATQSATCERALDRNATATDDVSKALANLDAQAKRIVTEPRCLAELTTGPVRTAAWDKMSAAYNVYSLGAERKDPEIFALGKRQVAEAAQLTADTRTAAQRLAAFREGCGL